MNIDWHRLVIINTPPAFRKRRLLLMLVALTQELKRLHAQILEWDKKACLQAAYTWQTIALEHMIANEMGLPVSIDEGDGKPIDFTVTLDMARATAQSAETTGPVLDESYLRGLLNKYKMAGRSYQIINSAVSLEVAFTNHVCEKKDQTFEVSFIDHVCVKTMQTIEVQFINHVCAKEYVRDTVAIRARLNHEADGRTRAVFTADRAVASDITIYYWCDLETMAGIVTIPAGGATAEHLYDEQYQKVFIYRIEPTQDEQYIYQIINS